MASKVTVFELREVAAGRIGHGDTKYHLKLLAAAADALEFPGDGHCNECGSFVGNGAPHAWKCPYSSHNTPAVQD